MPPVTSPISALTDDQFFYFLCLVLALVLFGLAANILNDRTGRAWRAVRDGLFTELPTDVSAYLRGCEGRSLPRWCFASLRDQLRNPVA